MGVVLCFQPDAPRAKGGLHGAGGDGRVSTGGDASGVATYAPPSTGPTIVTDPPASSFTGGLLPASLPLACPIVEPHAALAAADDAASAKHAARTRSSEVIRVILILQTLAGRARLTSRRPRSNPAARRGECPGRWRLRRHERRAAGRSGASARARRSRPTRLALPRRMGRPHWHGCRTVAGSRGSNYLTSVGSTSTS